MQTQRSGLVWVLFLHTHYKHAKDGTGLHWLSSESPQKGKDVGVGALKESGWGGAQLLRPQQTQKRETEYSQKEAATCETHFHFTWRKLLFIQRVMV